MKMNKSGSKGLNVDKIEKVDEIRCKRMKIYESECKWMKVDESG